MSETLPTRPITTIPTISPFESGDVCFDAGPEISQLLISPEAFHPLQDRQSSFLGKHHVLDAFAFGRFQVILGGKTAGRRQLARWSVKDLLVPVDQSRKPAGVGGIARLARTIQNQAGTACCRTNAFLWLFLNPNPLLVILKPPSLGRCRAPMSSILL